VRSDGRGAGGGRDAPGLDHPDDLALALDRRRERQGASGSLSFSTSSFRAPPSARFVSMAARRRWPRS
jgi:hypothetical protein